MQDPSAYDFTAPTPAELAPFFPAYQIHDYLAQGGMGAVYTATQTSLDRPVAIKILPRVFSSDPKFRTNFETEAKAMARLSHSNLIGVYDFGEADGMLFIVMELVEGKSLHESVRGQPIEQREAGRIVLEICNGLAHAHKSGIIHRDIKPGNILLTPDAEPKIGDFGLAHPLGESEVAAGESIWGTPGYTAPEVVHNPSGVDQRTDIFSVGVLLFELLTGKIPPTPPTLPSSVVRCDREFDRVYQRATNPDPAKRYPDADAMAKEVDAILLRLENPTAATPSAKKKTVRTIPSTKKAVAKTVANKKHTTTPRPLPTSPPVSKTPPKKSGVPLAVPIISAVVVIALIAIIVSNAGKKPEPPLVASGNPGATTTADPPQPLDPFLEEEDPTEEIVKEPEPEENGDPETGPDETDPEPDPTTDPEEPTPPATLASMAETLGKGNFEVLPEGAVQIGNFVFLLVEEPATWQKALEQAEEAGAQLAVLDSPKAVSWASENLESDSPLWLGLSDSGTEGKWYWASGVPLNPQLWAPGQGREGDRINCGALLPGTPALDDLEENLKLPFVLQWVEGRKPPGILREQLKRIGQNFRAKEAPIFPTGSINVAGSRFLLVPESATWEVANAAAIASGGHLAVPSSPEEAAWIGTDLKRFIREGGGAWIGGRFAGNTWKYTTGELFYFVNWAEDEPGDPAENGNIYLEARSGDSGKVQFSSGKGWEGETEYYIVEWSAPSRRNMPGLNNRPAEEWLTDFRTTFLENQDSSMEGVREQVRENAEDWVRDMKRESRDIRSFSEFAERFMDSLEEDVERTGRVPDGLPRELTQFLGDFHEEAVDRQRAIEGGSSQALERSLLAYKDGLEKEISRRTNIGDKEGQAYLEADFQMVEEEDYFNSILAGENPKPNPTPGLDENGFKEVPAPAPGPIFGID